MADSLGVRKVKQNVLLSPHNWLTSVLLHSISGHIHEHAKRKHPYHLIVSETYILLTSVWDSQTLSQGGRNALKSPGTFLRLASSLFKNQKAIWFDVAVA